MKTTTRCEAKENIKGSLQAIVAIVTFIFAGFFVGGALWLLMAYLHIITLKERTVKQGDTFSTQAFFISSLLMGLMFIGGIAS